MCPGHALLARLGWSPACLQQTLRQALGHGGAALMMLSQGDFLFEKGFPYAGWGATELHAFLPYHCFGSWLLGCDGAGRTRWWRGKSGSRQAFGAEGVMPGAPNSENTESSTTDPCGNHNSVYLRAKQQCRRCCPPRLWKPFRVECITAYAALQTCQSPGMMLERVVCLQASASASYLRHHNLVQLTSSSFDLGNLTVDNSLAPPLQAALSSLQHLSSRPV